MKRMYRERILNPVGRPSYLLTHPLSQKRIANLTASIRALGLTRPRFRDADDIERVKLLIELRKEPDLVVGRLRKAHERRPEAAKPAYSLGIAYAATGRWVRAREMLERAARLKSTSPTLDRDLGRGVPPHRRIRQGPRRLRTHVGAGTGRSHHPPVPGSSSRKGVALPAGGAFVSEGASARAVLARSRPAARLCLPKAESAWKSPLLPGRSPTCCGTRPARPWIPWSAPPSSTRRTRRGGR